MSSRKGVREAYFTIGWHSEPSRIVSPDPTTENPSRYILAITYQKISRRAKVGISFVQRWREYIRYWKELQPHCQSDPEKEAGQARCDHLSLVGLLYSYPCQRLLTAPALTLSHVRLSGSFNLLKSPKSLMWWTDRGNLGKAAKRRDSRGQLTYGPNLMYLL